MDAPSVKPETDLDSLVRRLDGQRQLLVNIRSLIGGTADRLYGSQVEPKAPGDDKRQEPIGVLGRVNYVLTEIDNEFDRLSGQVSRFQNLT